MAQGALDTHGTIFRRACILDGSHQLTAVRGRQRVEAPLKPLPHKAFREVLGDVDLVVTQRMELQGDVVAELDASCGAHLPVHVGAMRAFLVGTSVVCSWCPLMVPATRTRPCSANAANARVAWAGTSTNGLTL